MEQTGTLEAALQLSALTRLLSYSLICSPLRFHQCRACQWQVWLDCMATLQLRWSAWVVKLVDTRDLKSLGW